MQKDILCKINNILSEAGCHTWYLFGSYATETDTTNSDIDIGVLSLEPSVFYKVHSRLERVLKKPVDLVDFDEHKEMFDLLSHLGQLKKG